MPREPADVTLLGRVAEHLEKHGISFALIGASALAAHGVSRSTVDIDLLVTDPRVLRASFWTLQQTAVDVRQGDDSDPLAGVVRLKAEGERDVDVVAGRAAWQSALLTQSLRIHVEGTHVPVVDAVGLILLKLYAGGTQDRWDIEQLLAASNRIALGAAVDRQVSVLPADAQARWQQYRR